MHIVLLKKLIGEPPESFRELMDILEVNDYEIGCKYNIPVSMEPLSIGDLMVINYNMEPEMYKVIPALLYKGLKYENRCTAAQALEDPWLNW